MVKVHERYAEGDNILLLVPRKPKAVIIENAEHSFQTAEETLHTCSVGTKSNPEPVTQLHVFA